MAGEDLGHEAGGVVHKAEDRADEAFPNFDEARRSPDAAVILSGDYRGTIYLTAPLRLVRCDAETLNTLLSDLDAITWMGGDGFGASVAYERHAVPGRVQGGDGGGVVIEGVWTHPWFDDETAEHAKQVVRGERARIPGQLLRARRTAQVERRRESRSTPDNVAFLRRFDLPWDYDILEPVIPLPEEGAE